MTNVLFGLASFVFLLMVTSAVSHLRRANIFVLVPLCAVVVNLLAAVIAQLIDPTISYWLFTPLYYLLVMLFILCLGAAFSSVSFEMLHNIFRHGGRMNSRALYENVVQNGMKVRIAEHFSRGFATQIDDRLGLTPRGRKIYFAVEKLKTIFAITTDGIY